MAHLMASTSGTDADFIVKLTALALRGHPLLNARWEGDRIDLASEINVGIAVDTEAGLLVRRPHPEHGRVLQAYLTPRAETLLQEGHRRVRAIEERMMASLSHDQWLQLTAALQACADALEKDSTETGVLP